MRLHTSGARTACCVCGYHAAVDKLHACKREAKIAVGTYHVSKDSRFIGHQVESCHTIAASHHARLLSLGNKVTLKFYWQVVLNNFKCLWGFMHRTLVSLQSRPQTKFFARALRTRRKIGSGHFHYENWGKLYMAGSKLQVLITLSATSSICQKICQLAIYDDAQHNFMTLRSYNYVPVFTSEGVQTLFSTRPQGTHKNLVSGDETSQPQDESLVPFLCTGEAEKLASKWHICPYCCIMDLRVCLN